MHQSVAGAARPLQGLAKALFVLLALLALLATTSIAAVRPARAASAQMKAVFIVGPSSDTSLNKGRSDVVAQHAASFGMDVVKLYSPNATWAAVSSAMQGANLVVYMGHGNGWPSPYGPYQENSKDGLGLNASAGSTSVQYYGAKWIRTYITLAPNAIVFLNHLCYASGNGEPGMPIPSYDVARERADNYANGFLFAGARAVFAYGTGNFEGVVDQLFNSPNKTVDQIFSTPGSGGLAYYGFVGWNDKYFDSVRQPGFKNHLDPESSDGYRRAISGNMNMTGADWASGQGGGGGGGGGGGTLPKPTVTAPRASFVADRSGKDPVPMRLDWDASPSDNVTSYDLQYSKDGGTWTAVALDSPTSLSATVGLPASHDYRFRLRATDGAGTVGDWVTTAARRLGRTQEASTALAYTGTWSGKLYLSGASGSYVKKGSAAGQKVSFTFDGYDVGFLTTLGPNRGMAELWLDGTQVASLDLYSPTTQTARMVWASGVTGGTHTLEVRSLGTKNANSTAPRVDVDAFVVWK